MSTYDFSTVYTTLPHNLIKEKLTELIEQTYNVEGSLYLACNDKMPFYTSEQPDRYKLWSCQELCDALNYLLDNMFIRFARNYIDKLLVFQWVQIVLLLLQICFCFVMRDFCLFDLILYVPSTIFQLNRNGSSWVEPVLS